MGRRNTGVAPPRGERGLKYAGCTGLSGSLCRSPSWGAWIEISFVSSFISPSIVAPPRGERGLKFVHHIVQIAHHSVAPPRGERGLKCTNQRLHSNHHGRSPSWGAWIEIFLTPFGASAPCCRSPSWGAWIEIPRPSIARENREVAPPRGERGLKLRYHDTPSGVTWSLPLVGSVD